MYSITKNQFQLPAALVLVGVGLLWGAAFPAIDVVVDEVPPLGAAGIRYAVAGCIVLAYATVVTDRLLPQDHRELLGIACVGTFMFGGYQGALFIGTQYVSGAVAAVVVSMSPVVAAVIAVPLLGESSGLLDACGFVLGLAGVVVIAQPAPGSDVLSSTAIGVGLVFGGTAMFAVGSVTIQLVEGGLPLEALQGWAMLVGATLLFSGSILSGESMPAPSTLSPAALGSLIYISLAAGAAGYLLYFGLVRRVGATETTLVAYLEPVFATLVSVLFLGHTLAFSTVLGFLAVATGFVLVSRERVASTLENHGVTRVNWVIDV
ncbi:DMT family transporter [Halovenus rubra]|uniref:DMT family transporter n=2 Tax=Halovenus rubra TaxID=869890 RepID=A0ABD5X6H0_9EURY|nr:DMT family transporter [Halovenus rubra]